MEKALKIAHPRSKRGERKITSKFAESAREKALRNRFHLRSLQDKQSLAAIEQWVKRRRLNGKRKPTLKVQNRAVQQTFVTLHDRRRHNFFTEYFFSGWGDIPLYSSLSQTLH
jgi:hypothetical protein